MAEIFFYHLTESTLEDALPALVEKSLARGWKVVVQTGSDERRDALDAHLWTFRDDSFVAHACETDPYAAEQPVVLTTSDANANNASVRFLVDGASVPPLEGYERAIFMFDGHDQEQLEAARANWRGLKAAGHSVAYWQQTADRRWEKKA